ncbi:MAG: class I SAM-dependent methyltransferase, partial [Firmicutes bacterium]|nr:class I SAM-dependent methyltransferase [Bacillota bacterium]
MPCNLCGSEEYTVIYKVPPFMEDKTDEELSSYYSYSSIFLGGKKPHSQIVKCNSCRLVYSYPRRDDLLIRASYKNVEDACYLLTQEERRKKFQAELKEIRNLTDAGKILDVGCSTGIFLEEARLQGFDAYGVELSKWAFNPFAS